MSAPKIGPRCAQHGAPWGDSGRCFTEEILEEVAEERVRQYARYGTNDGLSDGTGPRSPWLSGVSYVDATLIQERLRLEYEERERRHGAPTWMHLVREEVAEAFQESDPVRLREELLQVAALCVSWVETLDTRAADLS